MEMTICSCIVQRRPEKQRAISYFIQSEKQTSPDPSSALALTALFLGVGKALQLSECGCQGTCLHLNLYIGAEDTKTVASDTATYLRIYPFFPFLVPILVLIYITALSDYCNTIPIGLLSSNQISIYF